jgi:hypothetical protein
LLAAVVAPAMALKAASVAAPFVRVAVLMHILVWSELRLRVIDG